MSEFVALFNQGLNSILQFLPGSPFRALVAMFGEIPYLEYLNWFLPITEMVAVLEVWLTAVALFYTYSVIMRFIRLIK